MSQSASQSDEQIPNPMVSSTSSPPSSSPLKPTKLELPPGALKQHMSTVDGVSSPVAGSSALGGSSASRGPLSSRISSYGKSSSSREGGFSPLTPYYIVKRFFQGLQNVEELIDSNSPCLGLREIRAAFNHLPNSSASSTSLNRSITTTTTSITPILTSPRQHQPTTSKSNTTIRRPIISHPCTSLTSCPSSLPLQQYPSLPAKFTGNDTTSSWIYRTGSILEDFFLPNDSSTDDFDDQYKMSDDMRNRTSAFERRSKQAVVATSGPVSSVSERTRVLTVDKKVPKLPSEIGRETAVAFGVGSTTEAVIPELPPIRGKSKICWKPLPTSRTVSVIAGSRTIGLGADRDVAVQRFNVPLDEFGKAKHNVEEEHGGPETSRLVSLPSFDPLKSNYSSNRREYSIHANVERPRHLVQMLNSNISRPGSGLKKCGVQHDVKTSDIDSLNKRCFNFVDIVRRGFSADHKFGLTGMYVNPLDVWEYLYQWKQLRTYGDGFSSRGHHATAVVSCKLAHMDLNRRTKAEIDIKAAREKLEQLKKLEEQEGKSSSESEKEEDDKPPSKLTKQPSVRSDDQEANDTSEFDENAGGGYIFAFGGFDGGLFYNDLYCFNTVVQVWHRLVPSGSSRLPYCRSGARLVYLNTRLYLFGGVVLHFVPSQPQTSFQDLYEFDLVTHTWSQLLPPPPSKTALFDGRQISRPAPTAPEELARLREERFRLYQKYGQKGVVETPISGPNNQRQISSPSVEQVGRQELPRPRRDMTMVSWAGRLYLFGGMNDDLEDKSKPVFYNSLYYIQLAPPKLCVAPDEWCPPSSRRGKWTCLSNLTVSLVKRVMGKRSSCTPEPRALHSAVVVPAHVHGFTTAVDSSVAALCEEGGWRSLGLGPRMVVFGGLGVGNTERNDLYQFWLDREIWEPIEVCGGARPSPRYMHGAALLGESMFIYGGFRNPSTSYQGMFHI